MDPDDLNWQSNNPAQQERNWEDRMRQVKPFSEMIDDFGPADTNTSKWAGQPDVKEIKALNELRTWWTGLAREDAELVTKKYQEYGNTALLEVGQQLADVMGRSDCTKAEAQELGIWFFMVGKMARWKTAILKGDRVSEDTLDDLAVYATMARRVHEVGGWPVA